MTASLLTIDALGHAYGTDRVLDDIHLQVERGEWVGLLGVNGAGKSTLLRCAAGLLRTQRGRIRHQQVDLAADPVAAKRGFGYAVDPAELPGELTLGQYLELVACAHGRDGPGACAGHLFEAFRLASHADKLLARCSLGTRQKGALVAAFIGAPELVLLDEPFNGLDAESQLAAKHVFADFSADHALLMASHGIEVMAQWCTRIVRLDAGTLTESIDLRDWRSRYGDVRQLERYLVHGHDGLKGGGAADA